MSIKTALSTAQLKSEFLDKLYQEKEEGIKNSSDLVQTAMKPLYKKTLEGMMEAELDDYLGYEKFHTNGKNTDNERNGHYKRNLKTESGPIELKVPRDRHSEFRPQVLDNHSSVSSKIEEIILSLYSKNMTTRDIRDHLQEVYPDMTLSQTFICNVTNKISEEIKEWQTRPLDKVYPIIYFDAIFCKVKDNGKIKTKAVNLVLGINNEGYKEILGIYVSETESSAFWLAVLTDLKHRGVEDILISCVDGLKGFPEAINTIYPKTEVQACVIHMIRNSLRYVIYGDQREFMQDLKLVYKAINKEEAESALDQLDRKWGHKYQIVIKSWRNNWPELSHYFNYGPDIRRLIYTTNLIEAANRSIRKATKNRIVFPNDNGVIKAIYLSVREVMKKWSSPIQHWGPIVGQLSIHFDGRINLGL